MNALANKSHIEYLYSKRSLILSMIIHVAMVFIPLKEKPVEEKKEEPAPMKVTLIETKRPKTRALRPAPVKAEKKRPVSPSKVQEEIKKPIPKKAVAGTQKVVPKSKALGNPKQKREQVVQKGDPMSTKKVAYKPGTDFLKAKSANIGGGPTPAKNSNPGGGSGSGTGSAGPGDTYSGLPMASNMKFLNSSGTQNIQVAGGGHGGLGGSGNGKGNGLGDGIGGGLGGGPTTSSQGTLEVARVAANVGSFTGAANGKIDSSKGAEGLARKGDILLAGGPSETIILGSIDPAIIRSILGDHRPQFTYCYQKVLDKAQTKGEIQGIMKLNFIIGGSGNVTKANVTSQQALPQSIKDCVKNVLLGIQFPAPKGGGIVEVSQPLSFRTQRI